MTKANVRAATHIPRYRPLAIAILTILCIPIFLYQLLPSFIHTTDALVADAVSYLPRPNAGSNFCTKNVGTPVCCTMYLDAAPCVDVCRQTHVDRETLVLTLEYDECADACLSSYVESCSEVNQQT
jgi:hypothetical protein